MSHTHEVIDFGPGPDDTTQDYPFSGTEAECEAWADAHNATAERDTRYVVQEMDADVIAA